MPTTEAEALFESGALYGQRALFRTAGDEPLFAGFKPGAFSLYFGDEPFFHFDLEGRWQRAYADGRHWHKGFDTTVQMIERRRRGANLVLTRNTLGFAEASDFDARVRSTAIELIAALDAGRLEPVGRATKARPLNPDDLRAALEQVGAWDASAWFAHRERYLDTYGPLPFFPPDCPTPVVLQATLGHESGISFGAAPAAEHHVRSAEEFERHARAVAALLGRRVLQCRAVFLGGSDVLLRPADEVAAYLETAGRVFPVDPSCGHRHPDASGTAPHRLDGVHLFLDRFPPSRPGLGDLRRFRGLGLVRVSLGIESGDPEILALGRKVWRADDLRTLVSDLKGAWIGVGVELLVGAGGAEYAARHLDRTAALVESLELGPGDLVSLLDAREVGAGTDAAGPTPLTAAEWQEQLDAWKARLAPIRSGRGVKLACYSLEKQSIGLV
jgi:hypothetical protein